MTEMNKKVIRIISARSASITKRTTIDKLKTKDGNVTECPNEILNEIKTFDQNLYSSTFQENDSLTFSNHNHETQGLPKLNEEDKVKCDGISIFV